MKKSIRLSMIAAIGKNRELGKNNTLCWNIPEDMRYFHTITRGHVVVMGQKTFESIGKPLKERINIVLSHDENFSPQGVFVVRNKKEALELAYKKEKRGEVFIIGGAMIYKLFLKEVERLYLTYINAFFPKADVFFPSYEDIFTKKVSEKSGNNDAFSYTFFIIEKL
ncbi:MAG: dihydrofolate reductase [Candidatus Moranbacteria bacterium]|nr:dihydrofolate reductase [Candidatus Moranbacteria bacterium]